MSADIHVLHPRADAPVATLPRAHFGLARPEDRSEQDRVKRAARAARDAQNFVPGVCPSLRKELATEIEVIAQMCATAAFKASRIAELRASALLREHQSMLETLSAEVEP